MKRPIGFVTASLAFSVAVIPACALVFDVDSLGGQPHDFRDATDDHVEGAADVATAVDASVDPCPHLRGGRMVDADGVCIDATKVTVAAYELFLRAREPLPRSGFCDWLSTWEPAEFGVQLDKPTQPITWVNWCQAQGYCTWAGKRLCGGFGSKGASSDPKNVDPKANQWAHACTRGGTQKYPYGQAVKVDACPQVPVVPVGTSGACAGPYEGLVDMAGNAAEWIDACTVSRMHAKDGCLTMNSELRLGQVSCLDATEASRDWTDPYIGFRCCLP